MWSETTTALNEQERAEHLAILRCPAGTDLDETSLSRRHTCRSTSSRTSHRQPPTLWASSSTLLMIPSRHTAPRRRQPEGPSRRRLELCAQRHAWRIRPLGDWHRTPNRDALAVRAHHSRALILVLASRSALDRHLRTTNLIAINTASLQHPVSYPPLQGLRHHAPRCQSITAQRQPLQLGSTRKKQPLNGKKTPQRVLRQNLTAVGLEPTIRRTAKPSRIG